MLKKTSHNNSMRIEDQESIRWLDSLKRTADVTNMSNKQIVTVCDREADIYDFF